MRGVTIKGFSNFRTETVQHKGKLAAALNDISQVIDNQHFKTKIGRKFNFKDAAEAIAYSSPEGKAVLVNEF